MNYIKFSKSMQDMDIYCQLGVGLREDRFLYTHKLQFLTWVITLVTQNQYFFEFENPGSISFFHSKNQKLRGNI